MVLFSQCCFPSSFGVVLFSPLGWCSVPFTPFLGMVFFLPLPLWVAFGCGATCVGNLIRFPSAEGGAPPPKGGGEEGRTTKRKETLHHPSKEGERQHHPEKDEGRQNALHCFFKKKLMNVSFWRTGNANTQKRVAVLSLFSFRGSLPPSLLLFLALPSSSLLQVAVLSPSPRFGCWCPSPLPPLGWRCFFIPPPMCGGAFLRNVSSYVHNLFQFGDISTLAARIAPPRKREKAPKALSSQKEKRNHNYSEVGASCHNI